MGSLRYELKVTLVRLRKALAYGVAIPVISSTIALIIVTFDSPLGGKAYRYGYEMRQAISALYKTVYVQITGQWNHVPSRSRTARTLGPTSPEPAFLDTSPSGGAFRLIGRNGKILHRWPDVFPSIWRNKNKRLVQKRSRSQKIIPLKNGDVLTLYNITNNTPYGGGLARLTPKGEPEWTVSRHLHHDLARTLEGDHVYSLYQKTNSTPRPLLSESPTENILEEGILKINIENGKIVSSISITELFKKSQYAAMINGSHLKYNKRISDVYHINSLVVFDDRAQEFPMARPGDILISIREPDMLAIVDPDLPEVRWAVKGPWDAQHAARPLPNGNIRIFDNKGRYTQDGWKSRIIDIDPKNMNITNNVISIKGKEFSVPIHGDHHIMENGNILAVLSTSGRVFEMKPSGDVRWVFETETTNMNGETTSARLLVQDMKPVSRSFVESLEERSQ